jgi:hypothetical protein
MALEILTFANSRWAEFIGRLHHAIVICEFPLEWRCDGDHGPHRYRYAKRVMQQMGAIDVESSIAFLEELACPCDCSVLSRFGPEGTRWLV